MGVNPAVRWQSVFRKALGGSSLQALQSAVFRLGFLFFQLFFLNKNPPNTLMFIKDVVLCMDRSGSTNSRPLVVKGMT